MSAGFGLSTVCGSQCGLLLTLFSYTRGKPDPGAPITRIIHTHSLTIGPNLFSEMKQHHTGHPTAVSLPIQRAVRFQTTQFHSTLNMKEKRVPL